MRDAPLAKLQSALGEMVEERAFELDGAKTELTLCPPDVESLREALRQLDDLALPALVRGAGSRLALGNPPRDVRVVLAGERLSDPRDIDVDEGVAQVGAGTPLSSLREATRRNGWEPALDAPEPEATVGGVLASAAVGPRLLGFGAPKHQVLGMTAALAGGDRARCGGRVVKNVTGYDLGRVYVGSLGTLCVIESVWLRLRSLPELLVTLAAVLPNLNDAIDAAEAASQLPSARSVALLDAPVPGHGFSLVVELAGDAAVVEADHRVLEARVPGIATDPDALARVRGRQCAVLPSGLRFRLACLPRQAPAAIGRLHAAGAEFLAYPGTGLVYANFAADPEQPTPGARACAAVDAVLQEVGGSAVLEAAPLAVKQLRDVFGSAEGLPIMRALKQRFDPKGILNPGRFMGRL